MQFLCLQSFSSVVGPNGSGKSNVIDAMLFVFGKKAKQVSQLTFHPRSLSKETATLPSAALLSKIAQLLLPAAEAQQGVGAHTQLQQPPQL